MKEVNRIRKIVAVRTTQRDISAMHLQLAKHRTAWAEQQLQQARLQMQEASRREPGQEFFPGQMERIDVEQTAAREEIAAWQEWKYIAEREQESAREKVKAQHLLLRQSERMEERAEKENQARISAAEQEHEDEQASRRRS